jgi:hypothetical protein
MVELPRLDVPCLFASSGLGDEVVKAPRLALFQSWFQTNDSLAAQQDQFHRHSWPERRHLSVCMRREGARTVSYTVIELRADSAVLTYFPQPPDEPGPSISLSLDILHDEACADGPHGKGAPNGSAQR